MIVYKEKEMINCSFKGKSPIYKMNTLNNQRLKITQFEKAHFIKVNELKLSQIELF